MQRLSPVNNPFRLGFLILSSLLSGVVTIAQNPHGERLKLDCAACHLPDSWDIPASFWRQQQVRYGDKKDGSPGKGGFQHDDTAFPLEGQHSQTDCRGCHPSLVFDDAESACISCHSDIHRQTVGDDCARCHSPESWLVDQVAQLHFDNGFPLLGPHGLANCADCHISASVLEFNRIGNDCINCHTEDFDQTANPNHRQAGYSLNCIDCHRADGFDWSSQNILHDFFPLTLGHDIQDCNRCHTSGNFSETSPECFSCHQNDYLNARQPDHRQFPTNCELCHTTNPGWRPANIENHDDLYFPIYSGNHQGAWNNCNDCHTTPGNFSLFSCIDCHEHNNQSELARDHRGVNGYAFQSNACYGCHPNGED